VGVGIAVPGAAVDDVVARLAVEGRAHVVMMLDAPSWPATVADQLPLTARLQEDVLAEFAPGEFEVTHRYRTVPALAGWITPQGYARLLAKKASAWSVVRAVDLDVAGGGEPLIRDGGWGGLAATVPLIEASRVHEWGFTGAGVEVAVLDSGFDSDHPDLMGSLLAEQCFCYNPSGGCCPNGLSTQSGAGSAEDDHGHGTHVSGIITSDGVVAPLGVAPGAGITMIKMLDSNNSFYSTSDIVAGLDWLTLNRPDVDVVSMSLQTSATFATACDNTYSWTQALYWAVENLVARGVMVVAIAGNYYAADEMVAPGCLSNVFNVGATDKSDVSASFSNSHTLVDVFAPGVAVTSDWPGGGTAILSGTSMACPHVSGLSALIHEARPGILRDDLAMAMTATGPLLTDWNAITHPRIDADDAVLEAIDGVFLDGFESSDTMYWSSSVP
jgi:subtilisin family serine protease